MLNIKFSVFTKPWKQQSLEEIGRYVAGLGFDGIEFPLREGYQVEPANAVKGLPLLVKKMREFGLAVTGVASATSEEVFTGCSAAGIPLIRIMLGADLEKEPRYVGAVWDAAHSGLAGEEPEQGIDIVWQYLCLINMKTAFYKLKTGPEAGEALFDRYFTTGRHGITSWKRVAAYLKKRDYRGVICLPAEYTDEENVDKHITEDIDYVRSLFTGNF